MAQSIARVLQEAAAGMEGATDRLGQLMMAADILHVTKEEIAR